MFAKYVSNKYQPLINFSPFSTGRKLNLDCRLKGRIIFDNLFINKNKINIQMIMIVILIIHFSKTNICKFILQHIIKNFNLNPNHPVFEHGTGTYVFLAHRTTWPTCRTPYTHTDSLPRNG